MKPMNSVKPKERLCFNLVTKFGIGTFTNEHYDLKDKCFPLFVTSTSLETVYRVENISRLLFSTHMRPGLHFHKEIIFLKLLKPHLKSLKLMQICIFNLKADANTTSLVDSLIDMATLLPWSVSICSARPGDRVRFDPAGSRPENPIHCLQMNEQQTFRFVSMLFLYGIGSYEDTSQSFIFSGNGIESTSIRFYLTLLNRKKAIGFNGVLQFRVYRTPMSITSYQSKTPRIDNFVKLLTLREKILSRNQETHGLLSSSIEVEELLNL